MTSDTELVERLLKRYTADQVPPCPVCGETMRIQSAGGGHATVYGCDTHRPFDTSHYDRSRWTQYRPGDRDVIDAIDALSTASAEVERLREALSRIYRWFGEFPETGRFWDEPNNSEPMSYGACFGSNGERDYMREIARLALQAEAKP